MVTNHHSSEGLNEREQAEQKEIQKCTVWGEEALRNVILDPRLVLKERPDEKREWRPQGEIPTQLILQLVKIKSQRGFLVLRNSEESKLLQM